MVICVVSTPLLQYAYRHVLLAVQSRRGIVWDPLVQNHTPHHWGLVVIFGHMIHVWPVLLATTHLLVLAVPRVLLVVHVQELE